MGKLGLNVPKLGELVAVKVLSRVFGEIWRNQNLQNLLKQVNPGLS